MMKYGFKEKKHTRYRNGVNVTDYIGEHYDTSADGINNCTTDEFLDSLNELAVCDGHDEPFELEDVQEYIANMRGYAIGEVIATIKANDNIGRVELLVNADGFLVARYNGEEEDTETPRNMTEAQIDNYIEDSWGRGSAWDLQWTDPA